MSPRSRKLLEDTGGADFAHIVGVPAAQLVALSTTAELAINALSREFGVGDEGTGDAGAEIPVPLEDGLVWAALHQDAIVVQLPDRSGPLDGHPAAALLRRGAAS